MERFVIFALTVCVASAALLSATQFGAAKASAYSEAVRKYCRADYKKYCGEYGLETNALRNCMNRHGNQLSKSCVRALVKSGEVSQREVNRRKKTKSR